MRRGCSKRGRSTARGAPRRLDGHLEAPWATILDCHGCSLKANGGDGEFVQPGNRHRFYTAAKPNARCDLLTPDTAMAKPPLFRANSAPGRLHHPVKPFKPWSETKLALREARVRQGARRRELVAWLRDRGRAVRS